jgi:hypothetical protein
VKLVAKFAAGVVDTGGKFAAGVVDTGGILSPVSLTHGPKTTERNFNLGVLNLYEIHFIALFSVKYPYLVSDVILHRI